MSLKLAHVISLHTRFLPQRLQAFCYK